MGQGYLTPEDLTYYLAANYSFQIYADDCDYLIKVKGKEKIYTSKSNYLLTRSDVIAYPEFLNLICPNNRKLLSEKLTNVEGKFDGRELMLP